MEFSATPEDSHTIHRAFLLAALETVTTVTGGPICGTAMAPRIEERKRDWEAERCAPICGS